MKRISPYLKMKVLGAIEFAEGTSIVQRIKSVSQMSFKDQDGLPHRFTWRTIQTWYSRYKKDGLTEFQSSTRIDAGKTRKVHPDQLLEAIDQVRPLFYDKKLLPRLVYKACIEKGLLRREEVSQTSFYRITKAYDLLKPDSQTTNKKRLAFAKAHANDMWQADTLFGPHLAISGSPQTKLIAFIDDASRVVPHGEFFLAENTHTMICCLRSALYKRGIPRQIYVDNGSIYTSKELTLLCSRLGILLSHAPVRDGAAKGKIERFFRTVRTSFLSQQLDLTSLEALNRQFIAWLEEHYNAQPHSSLGMKPIDRFGLDLKRVRFLHPDPANDELFYVEVSRNVSNTNTFRLKNIIFEVSSDLRGKKISVRFDRKNFSHDNVIVFLGDMRIGLACPVDLVANSFKTRTD